MRRNCVEINASRSLDLYAKQVWYNSQWKHLGDITISAAHELVTNIITNNLLCCQEIKGINFFGYIKIKLTNETKNRKLIFCLSHDLMPSPRPTASATTYCLRHCLLPVIRPNAFATTYCLRNDPLPPPRHTAFATTYCLLREAA